MSSLALAFERPFSSLMSPLGRPRASSLFGELGLFAEMERWMDREAFAADPEQGRSRLRFTKTSDGYELSVNMPGFGEEDVRLSVHEGVLSIKGESRLGRQDQEEVLVRERAGGSKIGVTRFERAVRLPEDIDERRVNARMKNGVLMVALPQKENAKPRQISISSG